MPGQNVGAPQKPLLKQKMLATTLIAFVITLAIYFYLNNDARAADYVAGGKDGCATAVEAKPSGDVAYVPDADVSTNNAVSAVDTDRVQIQLDLPVSNYTTTMNPDLSETEIHLGTIAVEKDKVSLNDKLLGGSGEGNAVESDCKK